MDKTKETLESLARAILEDASASAELKRRAREALGEEPRTTGYVPHSNIGALLDQQTYYQG